MKLDIRKLVKKILFLAFALAVGYFSFLYYKSYSASNFAKAKILGYNENNKDLNKEENKVATPSGIENSQNTQVNLNDATISNTSEEKQIVKEDGDTEIQNIRDYLKIVKALSGVIYDIYEDRDFEVELNTLKSSTFLKDFQKDFDFLDGYRIKFLSNANKNEAIFPNENLNFLSELIKIEKLNSDKKAKDEYFKNAILSLKKIEDKILSMDFMRNFFNAEKK